MKAPSPVPSTMRADRLPERQPEEQDGEDADEDRGELEVGRHPGPEQLERLAVPLVSGMNSAPPGSTVATRSPYLPSRTSATTSRTAVVPEEPEIVGLEDGVSTDSMGRHQSGSMGA